jgi:predicted transcriptional regulator of viral defense system/very-short-patch-repair endonuclease
VCCIDPDSPGVRSTPPLQALAELAGRQWGVVSRGQLRALGISRGAVEHWLAVGRLHGVYRGVYAVGHTALGPKARRLAAVLACGPGAVLSHGSAAAHWGLLATNAARVDVTAPASRRGQPKIRLHRTRSLDARDTTTHEGIPITTVARTLLDLAATTQPHRLERALAQADHLRLYDHRAITDVIDRANGHRGAAALARATAREPKLTKSDWEVRMLKLVRDAGLPEPLVNHPLDAPDYGYCEVDFFWPAHNLIVETDGWEAHGTRAAFDRDRAKDAALTAAGQRVLRFTWRAADATILRRLRAMLLSYNPAIASRNASSSGSSIE